MKDISKILLDDELFQIRDENTYTKEEVDNTYATKDDLENKAEYKGHYLAGGSSIQYVKICTVHLPVSNSDLFLEFDLAGRTYDRYQKVKFIARRGAATTSMSCALFVSGGKGNAYNVRAYRYHLTETLADEYIEVWCSLPAWDGLNILKKSFASNYTAIDQNFTWDYEIASAFPTTSDSIAATYSSLEDWTGKVDPSVVTMKNYSKPSSTSAITSADSLNSAVGKLEKALDEVSNVMVVSLPTKNNSIQIASNAITNPFTLPDGKEVEDIFMMTFTDVYGIQYTAVKMEESPGTAWTFKITGVGVMEGLTVPRLYWGTIVVGVLGYVTPFIRLGSLYWSEFGSATVSEGSSLSGISSIMVYFK